MVNTTAPVTLPYVSFMTREDGHRICGHATPGKALEHWHLREFAPGKPVTRIPWQLPHLLELVPRRSHVHALVLLRAQTRRRRQGSTRMEYMASTSRIARVLETVWRVRFPANAAWCWLSGMAGADAAFEIEVQGYIS